MTGLLHCRPAVPVGRHGPCIKKAKGRAALPSLHIFEAQPGTGHAVAVTAALAFSALRMPSSSTQFRVRRLTTR